MFNPIFNDDKSIKAIAMPMSRDTIVLLITKYPAFAAAFPTESSKSKYVKFDKTTKQYEILERPVGYQVDPDEDNRTETVIFENSDTDGTGWSHSRTQSTAGKMYFNSATGLLGNHDPNNPHENPIFSLDAFIRPEMFLAFDKNSDVVKTLKNKTRTSKVYCNPNGDINFDKTTSKLADAKVTSTAPIVEFGGRPYIWLNRSECISGEQNLMHIVSEKGYGIAPPFDLKNNTTDLFKARDLVCAYNDEVLKNLTNNEQAKNIIVCEYSSGDSYTKAKPLGKLQFADNAAREYSPLALTK